MSHCGIRPVDRSCGSYGPGHQVHWIQAKKSWEDEQPMIDVSIMVHQNGRVDIEGDGACRAPRLLPDELEPGRSEMTEPKLSVADAALRERIVELSVHIPCGGLRGPVHGRWQSCGCEDSPDRWEGCDVSREKDLCVICFRATAGGTSRWSWLACADCRRVNASIASLESKYGDHPFALGRHSLMNGIGVGGGAPPEVQQEQIARLAAFAKGDDRLREWRRRSTRDWPAGSTRSPTSY